MTTGTVPILDMLSNGGLLAVVVYMLYHMLKENRKLVDKLIRVIENNNQVLTELKIVIEDLRKETQRYFEYIQEKIDKLSLKQ